MASSSDFARVIRKAQATQRELSGDAAKKRLERVGKAAAKIADSAVRADIGDQSMSHWWKSAPIDIVAQSKALDERSVEVAPPRKTRGPWRVLEEGRKAYAAGDFRISGMRYRKKSDDWVQKRRRVKRAVGATAGKQTWSDAVQMIERQVPDLMADEAAKAFRRVWRA